MGGKAAGNGKSNGEGREVRLPSGSVMRGKNISGKFGTGGGG